MPNHYHYLIRQEGEFPVSKFPQSIFGGYSRALQYRHDKIGTLFEGRYKAKHVSTETYLLQLCCYIHANPVKAGLVQQAEDWPYSDFINWIRFRRAELLGLDGPHEFFDEPWAYRQVFEAYLGSKETPHELRYIEGY